MRRFISQCFPRFGWQPWHSMFFGKTCRLIFLPFLVCTLLAITAHTYQSETLINTMNSRHGFDGRNFLNAWFDVIDRNRTKPVEEQIKAVNDFFNLRIRYSTDILIWKKSDYWATPLETMGIRAGDCEDFAIAKYVSLIELGVPPEKLRLIYVKATIPEDVGSRIEAHMVLGYYPIPNAIPLIFDSLIPKIESALVRTDLKPVYSFNTQGLWVGNITASQADPTARLSPWRDVLQRMQTEGF